MLNLHEQDYQSSPAEAVPEQTWPAQTLTGSVVSARRATSLTITVGAGLKNTQGILVTSVDPPSGTALARLLRDRPRGEPEGWFSLHIWRGNQRSNENWLSAWGVALDIDHVRSLTAEEITRIRQVEGKRRTKEGLPPPAAVAQQVEKAARGLKFPGNIYYPTPKGFRLGFVSVEPLASVESYRAFLHGARHAVNEALALLGVPMFSKEPQVMGYEVDPATVDLARLFFTPTAFCKGVQRDAEVLALRESAYAPGELPVPAESAMQFFVPRTQRLKTLRSDFDRAVAKYNAEHEREYPRSGGDCPVCGHSGCFGRAPGDGARWSCFSSDHDPAVGVEGNGCYTGDALDLDAFEAGQTRYQVLREGGYLKDARADALAMAEEVVRKVREEYDDARGEELDAARRKVAQAGTASASRGDVR